MQIVSIPPGNSFARQRMDKSGQFTASTASTETLTTGWVPNSTYPATIVSNELVIQGNSPAVNITCSVRLFTDFPGPLGSIYLRVNGALVDSETNKGSAIYTLTWSGAVVAGDVIRLGFNPQGTPAYIHVQAADTYIDVNPA